MLVSNFATKTSRSLKKGSKNRFKVWIFIFFGPGAGYKRVFPCKIYSKFSCCFFFRVRRAFIQKWRNSKSLEKFLQFLSGQRYVLSIWVPQRLVNQAFSRHTILAWTSRNWRRIIRFKAVLCFERSLTTPVLSRCALQTCGVLNIRYPWFCSGAEDG